MQKEPILDFIKMFAEMEDKIRGTDIHLTLDKEHAYTYLMCNSYSQIMFFPGYLLFLLIVCKLFSLKNLALSLS